MRLPLPALMSLALVPSTLPAQDGIVWPSIDRETDAVIVQIADKSCEVFIHGFMTIAGTGKDFPDDVGAGIGISPGPVRKVDAGQFEDPADGEDMDDATPTFPFKPNTKTSAGFAADARGKGLVWSGFHCKTTRAVTPFRRGAFKFTVHNVSSRSSLVTVLTKAKVAVAITDSTGKVKSGPCLQYVTIRSIRPPEILYYSFDRHPASGPADPLVVNHAWPYAGAPQHATARSRKGSPHTSGAFHSALRGGPGKAASDTDVDSAWESCVHGSVTLAWWQRRAGLPDQKAPSFWVQGPGKFAVWSQSSLKGGLQLSGWSGAAAALRFKTDMFAVGTQKWAHVAVVLDDASNKGRLYIDGKLTETITVSGSPKLCTKGSLRVGGGTRACIHHLDEFRLRAEASSAKDIAHWAQRPSAESTAYGPHGRILLNHAGGEARLGNPKHAYGIVGPPKQIVGFSLGLRLSPRWTVAGAPWFSLPLTIHPGVTDSAGILRIPLPIPNKASLKGLDLHTQGFWITSKGGIHLSNPHLSSIQ